MRPQAPMEPRPAMPFCRRLAAPALLSGLLAATAVSASPGAFAAASPHHHTHHASASADTGPVLLAAQPQSALDTEARTLSHYDLEQAAGHGDRPLVLIGSARLDPRAREAALFVQLQSASLCGSAGCSTTVYLRRGDAWTKVLDSVSGPIRVLPALHGGMHDLLVNADDRWEWAGHGYRDTLAAPSMEGLRKSIEQHQEKLPAAQRSTTPKDTSP